MEFLREIWTQVGPFIVLLVVIIIIALVLKLFNKIMGVD